MFSSMALLTFISEFPIYYSLCLLLLQISSESESDSENDHRYSCNDSDDEPSTVSGGSSSVEISRIKARYTTPVDTDAGPSGLNLLQQSESFDTGVGTMDSDDRSEVVRLKALLRQAQHEAEENKRKAEEQAQLVAQLRPAADTNNIILTRLSSIESWMKTVDDRLSKFDRSDFVQHWLDSMPCEAEGRYDF